VFACLPVVTPVKALSVAAFVRPSAVSLIAAHAMCEVVDVDAHSGLCVCVALLFLLLFVV